MTKINTKLVLLLCNNNLRNKKKDYYLSVTLSAQSEDCVCDVTVTSRFPTSSIFCSISLAVYKCIKQRLHI